MMKSIDKLKRLTGEDNAPKKTEIAQPDSASSSEKQSQLADLRRRIENVVTRSEAQSRAALSERQVRGNRGLLEILAGEEIENEHGRFFLASSVLRGSSLHGHRNIREAFGFDMTAAGMLANNPAISGFTSEDALFLDTETTGLSGGTGTMAFLIGLGWFEDGAFHVHQILARDFGEEKAALVYLQEIAARKKFLVTFNGKAFDVNLLTTRFILNRLPAELAALPHLDLLHPSRRILGHRLENCRLVTLEEQILGVKREGDIPGWEIPQRYFDWLKRRNPNMLIDIFEHNRMDVISMATLTAHLVEILTAQAMAQYTHADDYLAAARLHLKQANACGAQKILDTFQEDACSDFSLSSKKKLAQLCKRTGRLEEAVRIWRQMAACEPVEFYAVSELAKYLEHREKDYAQAKALIDAAFAGDNTFSEDERASLTHRLARLNAKLDTDQ
ncbi:MAG TPA: ribonuclease H-like domain-containing protein [Smithellaceae bacterium]|nr:ribonuclease H-like domain-containing protein [Smithellaceae bacterium]